VLPTDTVYGVAADAFRAEGCARVFAVKRRERRFPLPVLLRSPKQLLGLCTTVPEVAERLMAAYWPGPLTMVVPADPNLRWDLGDARGTVAVRMPLDEVALAVIRAVGPLAVTSANRSGQPPATTAAEAYEQLGDEVPVYLDDGRRGGLAPSTIVDLTRGEPVVLRAGALPPDEIVAVALGELDPTEASVPDAGPDGG
jgi:L-threonylcarbamoyladenylate synthase